MDKKEIEAIAKTLVEYSNMFKDKNVFEEIAKDILETESIVPDEIELVKYAFKKVLQKYNTQMEMCKQSPSKDLHDLVPGYRDAIEKLQTIYPKL